MLHSLKCVFPPAARETPNTRTTQTQLPWQRQTSPISVTSLQTQSLAQTVCASLIFQLTKIKNVKEVKLWFSSKSATLLFAPGGADLRRGEGTFVFGWNPEMKSLFKCVQLTLTEVFCYTSSAHHPGETAIAARAPAAIVAGPETGATAPNPQVTTGAGLDSCVAPPEGGSTTRMIWAKTTAGNWKFLLKKKR